MDKQSNIGQNLSDESLMSLALKGEAWAFELVYERYANKLMKYVYRFTVDTQQAEDWIHETFLKLLEKPEAFDPQRRFSTWIYTVAGNVCRNHIRNEKNRLRLNGQMHTVTQHEIDMSHLDLRQLKAKIKGLFSELNQKEQDVFVLRFELEMSLKDISEILGIPEGSVKSCLYYLLKKIAPQLNEFRHG